MVWHRLGLVGTQAHAGLGAGSGGGGLAGQHEHLGLDPYDECENGAERGVPVTPELSNGTWD